MARERQGRKARIPQGREPLMPPQPLAHEREQEVRTMQVAMRLGPYWWKRLGEKKLGENNTRFGLTIREHTLWAVSFLAIAVFSFVGAFYFKGIAAIPLVNGIYRPGGLALVALLLMILALMSGVFCIFFSACAGVVFVRSLFATLRFRTIFGFSPPTTDGGRKAIKAIMERILTFRAVALDEEYMREEKSKEYMRTCGKAAVTRSDREVLLQSAGASIVAEEFNLGALGQAKERAKREYYRARNAARSPYLPLPFEVKESYKDYLPRPWRSQ